LFIKTLPLRIKRGRKRRRGKKRSIFPMSIKRDLRHSQIRSIINSLIRDNILIYFLENRQNIFEV